MVACISRYQTAFKNTLCPYNHSFLIYLTKHTHIVLKPHVLFYHIDLHRKKIQFTMEIIYLRKSQYALFKNIFAFFVFSKLHIIQITEEL